MSCADKEQTNHQQALNRYHQPLRVMPGRTSSAYYRVLDCLKSLLSVSIQVGAQGAAVSLSDRDGDPQLFEILIQRFPAEVDLARYEKVPHLSFEFRCGEVDDPTAHAPQPLFGEQLVHLLPVRFHKGPGQFSAIDIAQDGADEKRRVLRAEFSADGTGECAF